MIYVERGFEGMRHVLWASWEFIFILWLVRESLFVRGLGQVNSSLYLGFFDGMGFVGVFMELITFEL